MKKLIGLLLFCVSVTFADGKAGILIDPNGRPEIVPVAEIQPNTTSPASPDKPVVNSPTKVGTLDVVWPDGYIYYTLPGNVKLVTPWSAAILAYGQDFVGDQTLAQGYVPLATWKRITAVVGGGVNTDQQGSPLAGGMLNLVSATIGHAVEFHIIVTGGYDFNGKHAMAVLSPSVQFLK